MANKSDNLDPHVDNDDVALRDLVENGEATILLGSGDKTTLPVTILPSDNTNYSGDVFEPMILSLDDLFPDENGEVVISTEDGLPINLMTETAPDVSGIAEDHVTATGIDVSGLQFHSYANGVTIYFEMDSLVQITSDVT